MSQHPATVEILVGERTPHSVELYWGNQGHSGLEAFFLPFRHKRQRSNQNLGPNYLLLGSSHSLLNASASSLVAASRDSVRISDEPKENEQRFLLLRSLSGTEEWTQAYEGVAPGARISHLAASSKYHFKLRTRFDDVSDWSEHIAEVQVETVDASEVVKIATNLLRSIEIHNTTKVQSILSTSSSLINVDSTDSKGRPYIYIASSLGFTDIVSLLLEFGANPNASTISGKTPLLTASSNGHLEVIQVLLRSGGDPNGADNAGSTPLMVAAENAGVSRYTIITPDQTQSQTSYLDCMKMLLDAGADPNKLDSAGMSALDRCCISGSQIPAIRLLLEHGAKLSTKSNTPRNSGRTNLMTAVCNGHFEIVQFLVEVCHCDISEKNEHGLGLVELAKGHAKIVEFLERKIAEKRSE